MSLLGYHSLWFLLIFCLGLQRFLFRPFRGFRSGTQYRCICKNCFDSFGWSLINTSCKFILNFLLLFRLILFFDLILILIFVIFVIIILLFWFLFFFWLWLLFLFFRRFLLWLFLFLFIFIIFFFLILLRLIFLIFLMGMPMWLLWDS